MTANHVWARKLEPSRPNPTLDCLSHLGCNKQNIHNIYIYIYISLSLKHQTLVTRSLSKHMPLSQNCMRSESFFLESLSQQSMLSGFQLLLTDTTIIAFSRTKHTSSLHTSRHSYHRLSSSYYIQTQPSSPPLEPSIRVSQGRTLGIHIRSSHLVRHLPHRIALGTASS